MQPPPLSSEQASAGVRQIGPYRVLGVPGSSNMAVVYRAFDPVVERSLAVKVLRFRPRRRKKIVREARLRANLNLYVPFGIFETEARSILSPVSGFLLEAGFTHSLTPARNCTFGCSYCYVPTMRVQAGLRAEDWTHWGGHTTFKRNAAELLRKSLRPRQAIYCSPLTDPYQPAEADRRLMPGVLEAIAANPPAVFVIQTRGPLILRDIELLREAARRTRLRVGFSITTDREDVRRIFEPYCASIEERWQTVAALRAARIDVSATLAPILPCYPEALMGRALEVSAGPVVADPLHVRAVKRSGATTRDAGLAICRRHGWTEWVDPDFQQSILARMRAVAQAAGREFGHGPSGFGLLAKALF